MTVRYARDSKGRFASTIQETGSGKRKGEHRADLKRRLSSKLGGKKTGNRSLRSSVSKRVISKQERKSRAKYLRKRRG